MYTEIILKVGIKRSLAKPLSVLVARVGEVTFFLSFQNTFLPTMPEDNLLEAMAGMTETGSWYRK